MASEPQRLAAAAGKGRGKLRGVQGVFEFAQFSIQQGISTAMKVGTDAMLLGAWASPGAAQHILDVGCGTGVLTLMCAQQAQPSARMHAIDVCKEACAQTAENAHVSSWATRISVECTSLQVHQLTNTAQYDFVICNPPYFLSSYWPSSSPDSTDTQDKQQQRRMVARHAGGPGPVRPLQSSKAVSSSIDPAMGPAPALTYEELASGCSSLLLEQGNLCVVLPSVNGEAKQFAQLAVCSGLTLAAALRVRTSNEDLHGKRWLLRFVKATTDCLSEAVDSNKLAVQGEVMQGEGVQGEEWLAGVHVEELVMNEWHPPLKPGGQRLLVPTAAYLSLTRGFHHPRYFKQ